MKQLWQVLCFILCVTAAHAQQVGGSASLAVTTSTAEVALPASNSAYPALLISQPAATSSVEVFYLLGTTSGVTATTTSTALPPGGYCLPNVGPNKFIAGITATGSSTLRLTQLAQCPVAMNGGGGGGVPYTAPANGGLVLSGNAFSVKSSSISNPPPTYLSPAVGWSFGIPTGNGVGGTYAPTGPGSAVYETSGNGEFLTGFDGSGNLTYRSIGTCTQALDGRSVPGLYTGCGDIPAGLMVPSQVVTVGDGGGSGQFGPPTFGWLNTVAPNNAKTWFASSEGGNLVFMTSFDAWIGNPGVVNTTAFEMLRQANVPTQVSSLVPFSSQALAAWGTFTSTGVTPANNSTLTIGGTTVTLVTGTPSGNQVQIGSPDAVFTGSITGTTLNVTNVSSGTIALGQFIGDATGSINAPGLYVSAFVAGSGGIGTYTISGSQSVGSETIVTNVIKKTLANLYAFLSASSDTNLVKSAYSDDNNTVLQVQYRLTGAAGNAFTLAASSSPASNFTASAATLTNGNSTAMNVGGNLTLTTAGDGSGGGLTVPGGIAANSGVFFPNNIGIVGKVTGGATPSMIVVSSGNLLAIGDGSGSYTGVQIVTPAAGHLYTYSVDAGEYGLYQQDNASGGETLSLGTNSIDGWMTMYNPTATTGDTALKIRNGAARGAHVDFGNASGAYDVGIAHTASGTLTMTAGGTTFTPAGNFIAATLTAASFVGGGNAGIATETFTLNTANMASGCTLVVTAGLVTGHTGPC